MWFPSEKYQRSKICYYSIFNKKFIIQYLDLEVTLKLSWMDWILKNRFKTTKLFGNTACEAWEEACVCIRFVIRTKPKLHVQVDQNNCGMNAYSAANRMFFPFWSISLWKWCLVAASPISYEKCFYAPLTAMTLQNLAAIVVVLSLLNCKTGVVG